MMMKRLNACLNVGVDVDVDVFVHLYESICVYVRIRG